MSRSADGRRLPAGENRVAARNGSWQPRPRTRAHPPDDRRDHSSRDSSRRASQAATGWNILSNRAGLLRQHRGSRDGLHCREPAAEMSRAKAAARNSGSPKSRVRSDRCGPAVLRP